MSLVAGKIRRRILDTVHECDSLPTKVPIQHGGDHEYIIVAPGSLGNSPLFATIRFHSGPGAFQSHRLRLHEDLTDSAYR